MPSTLRQSSPGAAILFVLAPLMFASNMIAARWIGAALPPVTLAFGRWLLAALILTPFVWQSLVAHRSRLRAHAADLAVFALLGGAITVPLQYAATRHTEAGHVALVFVICPTLVALLERVVWKSRIAPRTLAGAAIAFAGIGVAVFHGELSRVARFDLNAGTLIALVAAIVWAAYTAVLRRRPVSLPPLVQLWSTAGGAALMLLPAMPLEWWAAGRIPTITPGLFGVILFVALVAGIGAYVAYAKVVAAMGSGRGSTSLYLIPVYAFMAGALLLEETLHMFHLAATILVFGGVALATMPLPRLAKRGRAGVLGAASSS